MARRHVTLGLERKPTKQNRATTRRLLGRSESNASRANESPRPTEAERGVGSLLIADRSRRLWRIARAGTGVTFGAVATKTESQVEAGAAHATSVVRILHQSPRAIRHEQNDTQSSDEHEPDSARCLQSLEDPQNQRYRGNT